MAKSSTKKRKVVVESNGEAHIVASFNNIIISLTNKNGDVMKINVHKEHCVWNNSSENRYHVILGVLD